MASQQDLKELWLSAPEGRLCAREQAKAWGLREAWLAEKKSAYGMSTFIAGRVCKNVNGKPCPQKHPTSQSIGEFFAKVDEDEDWFPGKQSDSARGPKRLLSGVRGTGLSPTSNASCAKL